MNSQIKVCIAGVSGWAGSALAAGIVESDEMDLAGAVSRKQAGKTLHELFDHGSPDVHVSSTVKEALECRPDVFVEYTLPDLALGHVMSALDSGAHVVIGTSGLSEEDFREIGMKAESVNRGVLACGNFSITAELMQQFAEIAARWVPSWEIIDYAGAGKPDAPSGTARELASRLGRVGKPKQEVPPETINGPVATRGANLDGTQVHAVRLPGYVLSVEAIFAADSERVIIKHEAGESAVPYVFGGLLAIRGVPELLGLHRGLSAVMTENN